MEMNEQMMDQGVDQSVEETADESFDFGIDSEGNVVFADYGDDYGEEDSYAEEQPEELYTVKVGGQDVQVTMDELRSGYMRNADYTQKTQALAEQRRMLEQQNYYQPQPQAQPQPEAPPTPDIRDYYQQLADYAKAQVENNLGEEFDEFNPVHTTALADEVANVKAYIVQQQAVQNEFNHMCSKFASDPNFREIDRMAMEELNNLPYATATKIVEAMQTYNVPVIDEYMTAVRDKYYGRLNSPAPQRAPQRVKPPYAERGGSGVEERTVRKTFDPKMLGKMSLDQQAAVFSKMGLSKL